MSEEDIIELAEIRIVELREDISKLQEQVDKNRALIVVKKGTLKDYQRIIKDNYIRIVEEEREYKVQGESREV